jgi:hypothetical protein
MNSANFAEAKTEALRKAARSVEQISATLQSKADTIRQLSQQVRWRECEIERVMHARKCVAEVVASVELTMLQGVHKALIQAEQKEMGSQ